MFWDRLAFPCENCGSVSLRDATRKVLKMEQDARRTLVPTAWSVSMNTPVQMDTCRDPFLFKPLNGWARPNSSRYAVSPGISRSARASSAHNQIQGFRFGLCTDLNSEKKRSTEIESCDTELQSNSVTLHLGADSLCEKHVCSRWVNVTGAQAPDQLGASSATCSAAS